MSEKVLGFKEKDAFHDKSKSFYKERQTKEGKIMTFHNGYHVCELNLIPVNLKSESVSLEWLEKETIPHDIDLLADDGHIIATYFFNSEQLYVLKRYLISAAKKQASEGK